MRVLLLSSGEYTHTTSVVAVYSSQKGISAVAHACRLWNENLRGNRPESVKHETDLEGPKGQIILHRWSIYGDFVVEITSCKVITE